MPGRFQFSLEQVLVYRIQLEEQAILALSRAQHTYQSQADVVNGLRTTLDEHEESLHDADDISAGEMYLWQIYKDRLVQDIRRAEQHMLELAKELNRRRREAVVKSRERKLLEKLKQKQAIRHAQEESSQEQKSFDEMATVRYRPPAF